MCRQLFKNATAQQISAKLGTECPIRIFPNCHPRALFNVFLYPNTGRVKICCSQCDAVIQTIKARLRKQRKRKKRGQV